MYLCSRTLTGRLTTSLKLAENPNRRATPGHVWTAADELNLRKSEQETEARLLQSKAASGKGKGSTASPTPAPPPPNCKNCLFPVTYSSLAAVQVTNGQIFNWDQSIGESTEVAICDACKCGSTLPLTVAASYEGECDSEEMVDVLEVVIVADRNGSIEVTCPDLSYDIDWECRTFDILNPNVETFGTPSVPLVAVAGENHYGPLVVLDIERENTAYCRFTCTSVGLP